MSNIKYAGLLIFSLCFVFFAFNSSISQVLKRLGFEGDASVSSYFIQDTVSIVKAELYKFQVEQDLKQSMALEEMEYQVKMLTQRINEVKSGKSYGEDEKMEEEKKSFKEWSSYKFVNTIDSGIHKIINKCDRKYPLETQSMLLQTMQSQGIKKVAFVAVFDEQRNYLPSLLVAVKQSIDLIGRDNVFVSIVDSGKNSKQVSNSLIKFKEQLESDGIESVFIFDKDDKTENDPISYMVKKRNLALEPVIMNQHHIKFDKVVFFENSIMCKGDILRLLAHDADMSCGYDFNYGIFQDNWVYETLPNMKRKDPKYLLSEINMESGVPVPLSTEEEDPLAVFCCWGGMTAFKAKILYDGVKLRTGSIDDGECYQSEKSMFCLDVHKLGYNRIICDPTVQLAYQREGFHTVFRDSSNKVKSFVHSASNFDDLKEKVTWRCCENRDHDGKILSKNYVSWDLCRNQDLTKLLLKSSTPDDSKKEKQQQV